MTDLHESSKKQASPTDKQHQSSQNKESSRSQGSDKSKAGSKSESGSGHELTQQDRNKGGKESHRDSK